MSELQRIIKNQYSNDWIALSNADKIYQLTNMLSSQKNHYGFKPQGLWLGLGDNWLQYIKDNDMTDWITEYCSAFSIKLGSNFIVLKDEEDYLNFTKRYSKTPFVIKWDVVAKKYDGIIAYAPRRFAFNNRLAWTYGWDVTSACVWKDEGIKDVEEIFNGCNDENFKTFKDGGQIHYTCVLINQNELVNRYGQTHENLYSHHSTIEYKPKDIKGLKVGKEVELKIVGRLTNDKLDVLLVDNPYSKNKYPHITLSTSEGVKPFESNIEIENNLDDIIPLDGVLKGVITVCRFEQGGEIEDFKKGGNVVTWKHKYNKKYGYPKNESHSLKEISKDTGVSMKGLRQIYNKGIGAYKTNPSSVRPNVTSKEQWAMARVYSSVMGGKASKVDAKELKMEKGGIINNPNFKSWFGDSKVVDENGNPLVVYHGTSGDFEAFDKEYQNEVTGFGDFGKGFYFSSIYDGSRYYTIGKDNSYILKVYLKVENPFVFDLISEKLNDNTKERLLALNVDIPIKHIIQDLVNKNQPFAYRELGKTISDETLSQIFIDNGYDGVFVNRSFITNDGTGDKLEKRNLYEIVVYEPTQIKSAIGNNGEYDPNNPSIIMAEGGQVCTYDFDGYDLAKKKCGDSVDVFLIPAEYDRVAINLFENHFPLWLYYNYLSRIVISKEDVFAFKKQCLEKFEVTNPVQVLVKPSDDSYWKKTPFGQPRSFMRYVQQKKGLIESLLVALVQDGFWANKFKERTSGLTLPHPRGVQLNTVIHEFAHVLDVIRFNLKNPNENIIATHQRGFIVALTDILIASKKKEIPIVNQVDNKALIIQRALQKPSFVERYKDQYGLNVFDVSIPKDLKEYDERFAYLKGAKLNKQQAKEIFDLVKKYQDEILMNDLALRNPTKANRLYKSTNVILEELKKYS